MDSHCRVIRRDRRVIGRDRRVIYGDRRVIRSDRGVIFIDRGVILGDVGSATRVDESCRSFQKDCQASSRERSDHITNRPPERLTALRPPSWDTTKARALSKLEQKRIADR